MTGEKLKQSLQRGEDKLRGDGDGTWENVDCEGPGTTQAEMSNKELVIRPLQEGKARLRVEPRIPYPLGGGSRFWKQMRWPRWTTNSNGKGDPEGSGREAPDGA